MSDSEDLVQKFFAAEFFLVSAFLLCFLQEDSKNKKGLRAELAIWEQFSAVRPTL
jgi:hypothetical protein